MMLSRRLILASASPRRKELLSLITENFSVIASQTDEIIDPSLSFEDLVKSLAKQKALAVSVKFPEAVVIGADTMVFCENRALGKPKDENDAKEILNLLSGRTHSVITAIAITKNDEIRHLFSEKTEVEFYPLTDKEITDYIKTKEPMDKAGAYGIQGKASLFVKRISGDFFNVVGFPVGRVYRSLLEEPTLGG